MAFSDSQFDTVVKETDAALKVSLHKFSNTLFTSMESYRNTGIPESVVFNLAQLENYQMWMVRRHLSWNRRLVWMVKSFFSDDEMRTAGLRSVLESLKRTVKDIVRYKDIMEPKLSNLDSMLLAFGRWLEVLTTLLNVSRTGELNYLISKMVTNNTELFHAQHQFRQTVQLNISNFDATVADITHLVQFTEALQQNTISVQHFFEKDFRRNQQMMRRYLRTSS